MAADKAATGSFLSLLDSLRADITDTKVIPLKKAINMAEYKVDDSVGWKLSKPLSAVRRYLAILHIGEHIVAENNPVTINVATATKDLLLNRAKEQD